MNAIVHAGGGIAEVFNDQADIIQVWICDRGAGIAMEHLPRATLERGFTTAGTLGHGIKMVLSCADRMWLQTGQLGTTVLIEQHSTELPPAWLEDS
jgi:signal transduction histidine kinase